MEGLFRGEKIVLSSYHVVPACSGTAHSIADDVRMHDSDYTGATVPACATPVHPIVDDVRIYRKRRRFQRK